MDDAVRAYVAEMEPGNRMLFDRLDRLILAAFPDASVVLSYKMPTYKVGRRKLHVGAWQHGLSVYGWPQERVAGFFERHPDLRSSKGTIRLRTSEAADISDGELTELVHIALDA